jgi:4-hydroxy-tetrahydrodipicolinate reductase
MPAPLKLAIVGAQGRMGQALISAIGDAPGLALAALVVRPGSAVAGATDPVSGLVYGADLAAALPRCDVAIEFTRADSVAAAASACAAAGKPLVAGSTGLDPAAHAALDAAAGRVAVLQAANFAPGVVVLAHLVAQAARALPGFAVEIEETHHLHKKDSPSGTALRLRDAVRAGRGPDAEAPIRSHRRGEVVGDHQVVLTGPGERLVLAHHADDRAIFARGALAAAAWLARQPAGRYGMDDVLGLHDRTPARPLARSPERK